MPREHEAFSAEQLTAIQGFHERMIELSCDMRQSRLLQCFKDSPSFGLAKQAGKLATLLGEGDTMIFPFRSIDALIAKRQTEALAEAETAKATKKGKKAKGKAKTA